MNIVCASICYRGWADDEIEATLRNAPAIGYRAMEIHGPAVWSPQALEALDAAAMDRKIRASGMRCVGIYTPGWGGRDAPQVETHARAIARAVSIAALLGADHVTSTGATARDESGLGSVVDCVRRVLDLSDPGVALALEPHRGNVLEQPRDFERVLDAVGDPRVGVCIDTGHFHASGVDTVAAIRRFAGRIVSVHLKDHVGAVSVGIGRGEIDLRAVLDALGAADYTGDLTVELEVEDPANLDRYTREAFYYISGMLGARLP